MTDNLGADLNATIAHAVNARIEAQVLAALADSDVMGRMVTAALLTTCRRRSCWRPFSTWMSGWDRPTRRPSHERP